MLWKERPEKSPAAWALSWVWNRPEVSVVLSGLSEQAHLNETLAVADAVLPGSMSDDELAMAGRVRDAYKAAGAVNCTSCRYCMPCPTGINIPELLWVYNHAAIFNDPAKAKFIVTKWLKEHERPSQCIECGTCEEKCPQHIEIMRHLKIIADTYEFE